MTADHSRSTRRLLIGVAVAALAAGAAMAQEGANPEAAETQPTEQIVVTGRAQTLYRTGLAETGKLETPPLQSSLNVQILNENLIEDQGARDAQDLYRNIAGVSLFSYAGVTARGFRQEEIFFDGLRGDPYAGFSVPALFNVARVEVLKGPAGMLYGPGAPGGLFNYVTKTPEANFAAELTAVLGTEARHGASGEITGAVPGAVGVAGRLGVFFETRNTPRTGADSETAIYDLGTSFDLGWGTLTLQGTRYEQDLGANRLRGVPVTNAGDFIADRRWNHNEPTDFLRLESDVLQARLDGQVSEALTFNLGVRWNDAEERQQYHEPSGLTDTDGDGVFDLSRREWRDQTRPSESLSIGANAVWSADLGPVANRVLVGADWYEEDSALVYFRARGGFTAQPGLPTPLSLQNPQYGVTDPANYTVQTIDNDPSAGVREGVYVLEEAALGRFIGVLGVRLDRFEDESGAVRFMDEAATWRAGLVYRLRDDVSLYGQWAESFEPQDAFDQDPLVGGPFEPTTGDMLEAGIKTELLGGRLQSTAAIYRIVRENLLQADPRGDVGGDGFDDFIAFGEVTSEGVEVDLAADLTDDWVLTGSYAYNNTRITADNGETSLSNSVGDRFANAPEHQLGVWTRYQVPGTGLALAAGLDHVSERLSLSGQTVQAYTVYDASVIYDFGDWSALVRVDNLFDETYAASGFLSRTGHFPGEPRSVFLEVSRQW